MSRRSSQESLKSSRSPFLFESCALDTAARVLTRDGQQAPLSPRAFELLLILIEGRRRAVSKKELLDRFLLETFASAGSLHNLIAEVRAVILSSVSFIREGTPCPFL